MKSTLRISLKSGERIFINGAVLRVDRKVALEFLNDVTFLLENHVLQPEQATTPLRQLYFIAQMMLINPEGKDQSLAMFRKSVIMLLSCFKNEEVLAELKRVDALQQRLHDLLFQVMLQPEKTGRAESRCAEAGCPSSQACHPGNPGQRVELRRCTDSGSHPDCCIDPVDANQSVLILQYKKNARPVKVGRFCI